MTVFAWPSTWIPQTLELALVPNIRSHASPYSGDVQAIDLVGERWRMALLLPEGRHVTGPAIEAFFARLHGRANRVTFAHFLRPVPRGTQRGSMTLGSLTPQGSNVIAVVGTANATLLAGDIIGIGGEWLMVAADTMADGAGNFPSLPLANRLRVGRGVGYPVDWNRPLATFALTADVVPVGYAPGVRHGVQAEFLECWG